MKSTSTTSSAPSLVIPPSSAPVASTSAAPASFDKLAQTIASLVDDPEHRSPTRVQRLGDEVHYAFDIPGVKQAMLAVVDHRPDAWSFDLYAQGLGAEAFGALKPMRPPKEGGLHWIVLDGPLRACQIFRAPDDPALFVVQSPTWLDAHE